MYVDNAEQGIYSLKEAIKAAHTSELYGENTLVITKITIIYIFRYWELLKFAIMISLLSVCRHPYHLKRQKIRNTWTEFEEFVIRIEK